MPGTAQPLDEKASDADEQATRTRIEQIKDRVETEEATKNAFIMPFIQALGYDVFNPMEVVPGSSVGHTAYNGVTRQIPGTQNLHAPIPSIEEEPRWMQQRRRALAASMRGAAANPPCCLNGEGRQHVLKYLKL